MSFRITFASSISFPTPSNELALCVKRASFFFARFPGIFCLQPHRSGGSSTAHVDQAGTVGRNLLIIQLLDILVFQHQFHEPDMVFGCANRAPSPSLIRLSVKVLAMLPSYSSSFNSEAVVMGFLQTKPSHTYAVALPSWRGRSNKSGGASWDGG